jgi:2-oxoglutarate dehydrogenase E1 component
MTNLDMFYGPNAGYVWDLFERYREDPNAVDPHTRAFFEQFQPDDIPSAPAEPTPVPVIAQAAPTAETPLDVTHIVSAARLIRYIRELGHLQARIDPLGSEPPGDLGLEMATHGVTEQDLASLPADIVRGPLVQGSHNALEAFEKLHAVYAGTVAYETDHINIFEERAWLREAIESRRFATGFDAQRKRDLLERLTEVETFERFIHQTFPGQKRFSVEGCDMLVPMLDSIVRAAGSAGTHEVVVGMAHRGRLNVMAHVLGKPYASIFQEFAAANRDEGAAPSSKGTLGWTGDVKYHLGARREYRDSGIEQMPITLAPNPSHLEFVDPVVMGRARAVQEDWQHPGTPTQNPKASLSILIHGDAAFPGQGVVAESLNLSQLPGYRIGGTIHVITNNQIGFTTEYTDSRSTLYASDLAKGFEIPIAHVNADDPEACIAVARMAYAYLAEFGKDFLIDLVGYRRWGHNEGDEPTFTQPLMYAKIQRHPTVREQWARTLVDQGVVTAEDADGMVRAMQERLQAARRQPQTATADVDDTQVGEQLTNVLATGVPADRLRGFNEALLRQPEGFTINPKLNRVLNKRRTALDEPRSIDWGHAETLAFASILADGTPIRLTGQDAERGTFVQRHLVLHDVEDGTRYVPLQNLPDAQASFAVYNSPLSENAAMGFEYGYSTHAPGVLVLWEGQFGDFANGAQVIIDQFIMSGRAKWRQRTGLVLLLPHGYEGAGPEHSSARLERFLQLAAGDNVRVANCTTAAQYFHLLRRQASLLQPDPRPLVVMTPKSLLRHPLAAASLEDLAEGSFQPVLDDPTAQNRREEVTRLILCSGKVYVDLIAAGETEAATHVAIARIEELHPFPVYDLEALIQRYPNLRQVIWLQEEPRNMGAWSYVSLRLQELLSPEIALTYVGRPPYASPAEGSLRLHTEEQTRILQAALGEPVDKEAVAESEAISGVQNAG